jgi:FkbM family methyltransferase
VIKAKLTKGSPRVRSAAQFAKRARRRIYERAGSDRYSHPAYDELDFKLADYLPDRGGIFVEAGAYDGYWGSNTYWFERFRGWTGVLVEPLPELAAKARRERPRSKVFQCALVTKDASASSIVIHYGGVMSSVSDAWESDEDARAHAVVGAGLVHSSTYELIVSARTLNDVLTEAGVGEIDLLSLDVEGYEISALQGLDLSRHKPRFMLIEMLREDYQLPAIEQILGDQYRHEAQLSERDHLYRRVDTS